LKTLNNEEQPLNMGYGRIQFQYGQHSQMAKKEDEQEAP